MKVWHDTSIIGVDAWFLNWSLVGREHWYSWYLVLENEKVVLYFEHIMILLFGTLSP